MEFPNSLYGNIANMKLRGLDIDDLLILIMLGDGLPVKDIAAKLNITQPAVSQRLVKIRTFTFVCPAIRCGRTIKITQAGEVLARGAKEALIILLRSLPDPFTYRGSDTLVHYVLSKRSDWAANEGYDA